VGGNVGELGAHYKTSGVRQIFKNLANTSSKKLGDIVRREVVGVEEVAM
jgi:hypothetical protein